jgi:hypothetical protein
MNHVELVSFQFHWASWHLLQWNTGAWVLVAALQPIPFV